MLHESIELGCGLIGIGRKWGYKETPVPTPEEAFRFLQVAFLHSIRYFDTAPSYGESEKRLGHWLTSLPESDRKDILVATKVGEHWSDEKQEPYTDHSLASMKKSVDQSLERLGTIDVLQLHKTNPSVISHRDTQAVWHYAKEKGVKAIGVSVSDLDSAKMAVKSDWYDVIQLPFNQQSTQFKEIITTANGKGKTIVVNRPFNMGQAVHGEGESLLNAQQQAFAFIFQHLVRGIILTGTKSPQHLVENIAAFKSVQ